MSVRSFLTFPSGAAATPEQIVHVGVILLGLVGLWPRLAGPAVYGAVVGVGLQWILPIARGLDTANHVFLEWLVFAFFALCRLDEPEENALLLQSLRFTIAIFFFYTGLQKVLYGYYFDGLFLSYMAAHHERFTVLFQWMIPAGELARLVGLEHARVGAGPYRVDAPLLVVASNAVYVFEMVAGALLLWARTRSAAAVASIAFVVAIEAGARELVFGALMINLLLLSLSGPWIRRCLPFFAISYVYLALAEEGGLGWLPMFAYLR